MSRKTIPPGITDSVSISPAAAENVRSASMWSRTSGSGVVRSRHANAARKITPAAIRPCVGAEIQPLVPASITAHSRLPIATATVAPSASERDRTMAARVTVSAFIGLLHWWLETDQPISPDEVNDTLTALILPGVANVLGVPLELPARPSASRRRTPDAQARRGR